MHHGPRTRAARAAARLPPLSIRAGVARRRTLHAPAQARARRRLRTVPRTEVLRTEETRLQSARRPLAQERAARPARRPRRAAATIDRRPDRRRARAATGRRLSRPPFPTRRYLLRPWSRRR